MADLSEERKRQIRAEEEAAFRARQAAEAQYREQVRREIEEQQQAAIEQQYREQLRQEFDGQRTAETAPGAIPDSTPPIAEDPPVPTVPEGTAISTPVITAQAPQRRPATAVFKQAVAGILLIGGLVCSGIAISRGFALPLLRGDLTVTADAEGDFVSLGDVPATAPTSEAVPSSVHRTAPAVKTPPPPATPSAPTNGTKPAVKPPPPPAPARPATSDAKRVRLGGISIEAPSGWTVEPTEIDSMREIRWHDEAAPAYLLIQQIDLLPGEDLDDFGGRVMDDFAASTTPEQRITYEREAEIANFHGVAALSIDVVAGGDYPYRMRNLFWVARNNGYLISCYAVAGTFEDRMPAFTRMLNSVRL